VYKYRSLGDSRGRRCTSFAHCSHPRRHRWSLLLQTYVKMLLGYNVTSTFVLHGWLSGRRIEQVRQWGLTYIHTCRPTSTRRAIFHERRISCVTFAVGLHSKLYFPVAGRFVRFLASGTAKFPKMRYSLSILPMNHRAKFDAASFILGGEIRNRTNTQNYKKKSNKQY